MYGKDMFSYRDTGCASFPLIFNFFSIVILIAPKILKDYLWEFMFIVFIIGNVIYSILNRIYTKKRRESLREQYEDECDEAHRRRLNWVILYVVLSVALLIFAVWISWKINSKTL
jgi:glucan phosphoethanolaminetransferase (alkaline phosphatase superfamily)